MDSGETACGVCEKPGSTAEMLEEKTAKEKKYICLDCYKEKYKLFFMKEEPTVDLEAIKAASGDGPTKADPMFTPESIKAIMAEKRLSKITYGNLSKRPISCPHGLCQRYIRLVDIYEHFKTDHDTIAIISSQVGVRNSIEIDPNEISSKCHTCIAILRMPRSSHIEHVVFSLMAMRCIDESIDEDVAQLHDCAMREMLILWMAANQPGSCSATLAVSNWNETVRTKYYGPVVHLDNGARQLMAEGRGLMLMKFQFERMTRNGERGLMIDVVVHDD